MKMLMQRLTLVLMVLLLMVMALCTTSCSELRSEFDPHQWRYQPYPDMPPSWESDIGRPGPEYGGEDMFDDTW